MRILSSVVLLPFLAGPLSGQAAFLDRLSAAPGDTVNVHLSSSASSMSVWRTRYFGDDTQVLSAGAASVPGWTHVRGSYAEVGNNGSFELTSTLSLEAWIRPAVSGDGNFYGILSKYSVPNQAAFMIYLMPSGQLSFYLGATGAFNAGNRTLSSNPVPVNAWTHVVATYDGQDKRIYINGQLDVVDPRTGPIFNNNQPVRVAAYGNGGSADFTFNGGIDSPAIYNRALTPGEISQRFIERAEYTAGNPGLLPGAVAQWNFEERDGSVLADASANGNDLTLHNYGTRGVPGPGLRNSASGSHCVRFSDEDSFNPEWPVGYSFTVEPTWDSGLYYVLVAGVKHALVVKPDPAAREKIAVLAATNTWHAYNSQSGNNLYAAHKGGRIAYYVGMKQRNVSSHLDIHTPGGSYSHLADAERYLYKWLDDNGYAFDLYSDLDLHQDPNLLDSYSVLMLNGHNEYWTHAMIDHVEAFLDQGGSLVNLSGNTMWSLVTFDPTFSVMEGRKHPHSAGVIPANERWHSQDGEPLGGTSRCIGRPEHEVIGTGYGVLVSAPNFGWGEVLEPAHWVFAGTGVTTGSTFGQSGLNGGGMFGHESDVVLPQWTPPNTVLLAQARYPVTVSSLNISNCQSRSTSSVTSGGDVIYFDHEGGGGVFGIPSVAAGSSLVVDAVATQMVRNVLDRFLSSARCFFRNGSGINPLGYDCTTPPETGTTWETSIATTPDTTVTILGMSALPGVLPILGGEILIALSASPIFLTSPGTHSVPIPNDPFFVGVKLCTQGFRIDNQGGVPRFIMLNAQDVVMAAPQ